MAKLGKDTMAYKNKKKYIVEYNKSLKRIYIQLNPKTEADLIEWLSSRSKATYIKKLIREDIKRQA